MSAEFLLPEDDRRELTPAPFQAVLNRCVQRTELERIARRAKRAQEQAEQALEDQDAGFHR